MMPIYTPSRLLAAALVAAMAATGCTLDKQEAPSLVGPSTSALAIVMTASPDQLSRGTAAESVVTLRARNANGEPIAGQRLTLSLPSSAPAGARISVSDVTTDANGVATFSVAAPSTGSFGDIVILAVPFGDDSNNASVRTISIMALPSNAAAPTNVVITELPPTTHELGDTVTLQATATDEGVNCTNVCTFSWNFGDGTSATGPVVSKRYGAVATYTVVLTVTDQAGASTVVTDTVTIGAVAPPTVSFTLEDSSGTVITSPVTGQATTFRATAVASGLHTIVRYEWTWGDGETTTSQPVARHTFEDAGNYLVSVRVTDDLGQTATNSRLVTATSGVTASFTSTQVGTTTRFNFDGTASSSQFGSIVSYTWDFGDGTTTTTTVPTASRTYSAGLGATTVRLTVTDSADRTGTITRTITVP
jgi:PKD repeat protein